MEARQQKVLARFGQVMTFLDANTSRIDPTTVANQRQVLASAIVQINGFAQDQIRKGTETVLAQSLSSARVALRDTYMRQVVTVGQHTLTGQHAGDPNVANARQVFTLPATRTNPLTLIAAAQAMVQIATNYKDVFTLNGVNLDAMAAAIEALQAAVKAAGSALRVSMGATKGIVNQIQVGHGAVRLLDVVIRPQLAGDAAVLAQWNSVKRAAGGLNLHNPVPLPAPVVNTTPAAATPEPATASAAAAA
jgi:hypothetical protein